MVAIALRTAVALAAFLRQHGAVVITIDRFASWFRRTTAVGLGNVAAGLMTGIDVLVLGLVCAPAEVGRYGLATKLPLFLVSLIGLGYTALFPTLVRAVAQNDTGRLARIAAETIAVGLGVAIPGAICLCLAAEPLMVLLFTERFRSAAPLLGMLAWRFPLSAAVGVFQAVLWARSPQRNARVAGMVFVTTLAALPYAAHRAGAIGVGCCMLLADLLELVLYVRAAGVPGPLGLRTVARIAAGGGVAAAVMLAVSPAGGPAAIATIVGAWAIGAAIGTLPHLTRVVRAGRRFGRVP
jgi:O-antigen/teichoic acid export membrane protein